VSGVNNLYGEGDIMLITLFIHIPTPLSGDKYPSPPDLLSVSPLIYDKMTEIGGTIPYVNQKKFLGKNDPLVGKDMYICKKNFGKKNR
jgi:hypothetical protein